MSETNAAASTDQIDPAKVVENFKAEFIKDGGIVLGAWYDQATGFLVVYIDPLRMVDELEELQKVPAPGEYQGLPTVLTLFPQDQQYRSTSSKALCRDRRLIATTQHDALRPSENGTVAVLAADESRILEMNLRRKSS